MIEVSHLSKHYGSKKAVDDISFKLNKGEIVGFLGPNGAGKSTTMNMLTGYTSCTNGKILIAGHDILEEPLMAKKHIGYLPEIPPLYLDMTVKEYLLFVYELKKLTLPRIKHINEILGTVKIADVSHRLIRNLSKGYRQRVGLAQALLGNPDVLILDEPTVGLDPAQMIEMRNLISELGKDRTVILSSHILPEISAVCERIIIINDGKIVAQGSSSDLEQKTSSVFRILLQVEGNPDEIIPLFENISEITSVDYSDGLYTLNCAEDVRNKIFSVLSEAKKPILMMKEDNKSLEDIFMSFVSKEAK